MFQKLASKIFFCEVMAQNDVRDIDQKYSNSDDWHIFVNNIVGVTPQKKTFWVIFNSIFVKTSLLGPPGAKKMIFTKIRDYGFFNTPRVLCARVRARVVGRISGTVIPIKLKLPGLFKTPKINLYFKF